MIWSCDEDWVKKCIGLKAEYRLEDQERTWLDSVEADMAEFEIDIEDVHDRKK